MHIGQTFQKINKIHEIRHPTKLEFKKHRPYSKNSKNGSSMQIENLCHSEG